MNILHTFWLPDPTDAFVQGGDFHVWVESDQTPAKPATKSQHPRHLSGHELQAVLAELKIGVLPGQLVNCELALPSSGKEPLPSPELAPYVEPAGADDVPTLKNWNVACWRLSEHPIAQLNELHFQTLFQGESLRPGSDFLFWYWFTQSLKAILYKDAFIPSLRLREEKKAVYDLYAGWEIIAESYQTLLHEAAQRLPPSAAPGYEPVSLLRHCAEVLLHRRYNGIWCMGPA
jgi:hypothetical protein